MNTMGALIADIAYECKALWIQAILYGLLAFGCCAAPRASLSIANNVFTYSKYRFYIYNKKRFIYN